MNLFKRDVEIEKRVCGELLKFYSGVLNGSFELFFFLKSEAKRIYGETGAVDVFIDEELARLGRLLIDFFVDTGISPPNACELKRIVNWLYDFQKSIE